MKNRILSVLVALALVVVAVPAFAQTTGDVEGTVADSKGAPLPGVSVELKSPALQGARTTVTDASGRYRFPALPPGVYTATASLSGFTKAERTNVRVSLGGTASVDLTLSLSVKEEVVVTGEAPVIDTTKGTVGTTASIDTIQRLPLGRNFVSIATTVAGTGTSAGGGVTVYGATGLENQYIIDGVNTTGIKIGDQGKTLNNEFVQEVEVKTGGYEAEFSRALGGIINVVTKSGGNEFHGDVFGYYDNGDLAANDKRVADKGKVGQGELVLPDRLDAGLDLGGYFIKDRLWFFGAYDRVQRDQDVQAATGRVYPTVTTDPVVTTFSGRTDKTRTNLFSGKLTFRLGESNTVQVSAFGDPGKFDGQLFAIAGPDSAREGTNEFGATDFTGKWDGIFGTQFLGQAQYSRHQETDKTVPKSTALAVRNSRRSLTTYIEGSGAPLFSDEEYNRDSFTIKGTAFFGAHEIKGGLDYEKLASDYRDAYGGGAIAQNFLTAAGAYRFSYYRYFSKFPLNCNSRLDANGDVVHGNYGTPGAGNANVPTSQDCLGYDVAQAVVNQPTTRNLGFFVQDSWKVMKNLTVNAGLRYDQQGLDDASGNEVIKLKNEWSPRIGFVWDFMNNGKSKLYGNYGRYYTTIPQDIQTRALGNEYTTFAYNYTRATAGGAVDPVDGGLLGYAYIQGGSLIQPGLKGMYQDEWIGGVEYELLKNWSFGVKGIYKALGRTIEDRCDLADPRTKLASFIPAGALTTCALVNYGEASSALNSIKDPNDPKCLAPDGTYTGNCESTHIRRYYRGAELTATHRFSNNFYMLASYVYSSLKGNYDGNEKQSTGQQDPNINADFDYLEMIPNNFGRLALDRKHQFKMSGTYSFAFGLTAGLNVRYNSGAPLAVRGYARPGYTSERYLIADRGFLRELPSTYEADFHLEYGIRLGTVTITPIVDVFNLLNRQGVTAISGVFNTQSAAGANDPNTNTTAVNALRNNAADCAANRSYSNYACSTNPNYLRDTGWQNPTQLRLGARVSF